MPSSSVKTLLITSSHSGEGKTTTALNLAQALAQRKGPVLLMDCDLRKGGVARALGIENNEGVSTILAGERNVSDVLRHCLQKNLWVLTSGPVPSNPVGLLAGPNMAALLKSLSSFFECIIIDSPPVLAVTDAAILSSVVDGVLLVAASDTTPARWPGPCEKGSGNGRGANSRDVAQQTRSRAARATETTPTFRSMDEQVTAPAVSIDNANRCHGWRRGSVGSGAYGS